MRRVMRYGSKVYRPDNRLGSALVLAEDIADRDLIMQIIVISGSKLRLLDMRVRGRTRMTATDALTGRTERVSARAVWAVAKAASGRRKDVLT